MEAPSKAGDTATPTRTRIKMEIEITRQDGNDSRASKDRIE
jgi:hypothetical protein